MSLRHAAALVDNAGSCRAYTFVKQVSVHAETHLKAVRSALAKGAGDVTPELADVVAKLVQVRDGGGGEACAIAFEALLHLDGVRIFRRELAWAVLDTLRDVGSRPMDKLHAALRTRRNLTSHVGRRLARCTVGTTLLLKGMEFDHAIVIHTGGERGFSGNDLYVGLTRGSKSLTVLSSVDSIDVARLPS